MTLRHLLEENTATDEEIAKAKEAAIRAVVSCSPRMHPCHSEMIQEKITEATTFRQAALIIRSLLTPEQLEAEVTAEQFPLLLPLMIARSLLRATYGE